MEDMMAASLEGKSGAGEGRLEPSLEEVSGALT
jgi:hypothetical protein